MEGNEMGREDWSDFFEAFTRRHRGERVAVEVIGPARDAWQAGGKPERRVIAADAPLDKIRVSDQSGKAELSIRLGEDAEASPGPLVLRVRSVRFEEAEDPGMVVALDRSGRTGRDAACSRAARGALHARHVERRRLI